MEPPGSSYEDKIRRSGSPWLDHLQGAWTVLLGCDWSATPGIGGVGVIGESGVEELRGVVVGVVVGVG